MLDLFAGSGGVARHCRWLGYRCKEYDILHGAAGDLTSPSVLRQIRQDIRAGKVVAAILAPPSASFSFARDRTNTILTVDQPWGVSRHLLSNTDVALLNHGNLCFNSVFRIVKWLQSAGVPWILENPLHSKCW